MNKKTMLTSNLIRFFFIVAAGTFITPQLQAQAQSLLSSNQVVIARVENVTANTILISGVNFDKFKGGLTVSLSSVGSTVSTVPAVYNSGTRDITATLPTTALIPGTYRLMVSFGSGTAGTDVFEFVVGEVGPKGDKGDRGDKGDKGDKGEQGIQGVQGVQGEQGVQGNVGAQGVEGKTGPQGVQGVKGDQGATGQQGATGLTGAAGASGNFPIYQNWTEALDAYSHLSNGGLGVVWVQASSGQVFQITEQKLRAP